MLRSRIHRAVTCAAFLAVACAYPAHADAQWYFAGYLGGNYTRPAVVTIDQPALNRSLSFQDVRFTARPFKTPPYYGYRIGWMFGGRARFGLEFEFIHLKVIGDTSATVIVSGHAGETTLAGVAMPLDRIVQRYSMTHGLNFALINVVVRLPLGASAAPSVAVVTRAGVGPTFPHAETTIDGEAREQYEYAGMGAHAAAGATIRLHRHLSAVVEYKLTHAKPTITIAGGTGRTTALTHQIAFGLALGLTR